MHYSLSPHLPSPDPVTPCTPSYPPSLPYPPLPFPGSSSPIPPLLLSLTPLSLSSLLSSREDSPLLPPLYIHSSSSSSSSHPPLLCISFLFSSSPPLPFLFSFFSKLVGAPARSNEHPLLLFLLPPSGKNFLSPSSIFSSSFPIS